MVHHNKYPLLTFFVLTLVISWGGIYFSIGMDGILGVQKVREEQLPLLLLATLLGPSVAGMLMTVWLNGRHGLHALRTKLTTWSVHGAWYAMALFTAPLLMGVILLPLALFSPAFVPTILVVDEKLSLLLTGILMGLMVGFCEELGWSGFALPILRQRFGVFVSGLLLGVFWGMWHLPLFLGSASSPGSIPPVLYISILLFSFLPPYRMLMVWLYEHTQSLLLVLLMHMPLAAGQFILIPSTLSESEFMVFDLLFAGTLWLVVCVLVQRHWLK